VVSRVKLRSVVFIARGKILSVVGVPTTGVVIGRVLADVYRPSKMYLIGLCFAGWPWSDNPSIGVWGFYRSVR